MPGGLFWLQHLSAGAGTSYYNAVMALSPTLYYRLDEASGDFADSSGNGHTLTKGGTVTYGQNGWTGDGNDAALFDGSTGYATASDHADFEPGTNDWSLVWAQKFTAATWPDAIVMAKDGDGNPGQWGVQYFTAVEGRVSVLTDSGYTIDLSPSDVLKDTDWHHCAVTVDRSALATFYVDGVSKGTVDVSADVATDLSNIYDLWLATRAAGSYYFPGTLDEVAFWPDRLLTASEVVALFNARYGSQGAAGGGGGGGAESQADTYAAAVLAIDSGSVDAYYKMDEGSGVLMNDSSATDNDGSYQGSPTLAVAGPFDGATAAQFDGSTQWAQAPYTSALDAGTGDWSCIAWIKRAADTWTNWEWLIARPGEGYDTLELFTGQSQSDQLSMRASNAAETDTTVRNSDFDEDFSTTWHMVGLSADRDGNVTFWKDGVAYGAEAISSYQHTLTGNHTLYLARRSIASFGWWAGSMCQVSIWAGYLLTGSDVADLWTAAGN